VNMYQRLSVCTSQKGICEVYVGNY